MTCPHCQAGFLPEGARRCPLCGQLRSGSQPAIAVAEPPAEDYSGVDEMVRAELGSLLRIERAVKHGETSHVYFARDALGGGRETALKVIVRPAGATAKDAERFRHAARSAAQLDHPNIARPYRHGATDTLWWYAMEYVPAPSLADRLAVGMGRPLDVPLTWRIALQVASALDYAHRRGIVHGALKSTDVLLDDAGWVHVVDIGLAQASKTSGPLADQYALALIVRECLAGEPPQPAVQVLERALARDPAQRFVGVLAFVAALTGGEAQTVGLTPRSPPRGARRPVLLFETETPEPPRRRLYRVGVGVGVAVTGGVLWLGAQSNRDQVILGQPLERPVAVAPAPTPPPAPAPEPVSTAAPPAAAPAPPRATKPAPPRRVIPPRPGPGYLSVNSNPWALLSIDGRAMGTTPRIKLRLPAGTHQFRLQRAGFKPYDATVVVQEGATLVITNITLTATP
jgi:serine/threonine-protein kinase